MNAPIVTLTTDWGDRDHYVAMVKGKLYGTIPGVRVVDLSHSQDWGSMAVASKIVQYGCMSFPAGTVHIIDFCDDLMSRAAGRQYRPTPLLALCRGHFFLCCNRKLLEVSLEAECDTLVALPLPQGGCSDVFLAHSLFCDVAASLIGGVHPSELGDAASPLARRGFLQAQYDGSVVSARPGNIDHYGNVTLNLRYDDFEQYRAGRSFRMELEYQVGTVERFPSVTEVCRNYGNEIQGRLLLTVSSSGHLQLAINQGSVVQLMGVNYTTICRFVFL